MKLVDVLLLLLLKRITATTDRNARRNPVKVLTISGKPIKRPEMTISGLANIGIIPRKMRYPSIPPEMRIIPRKQRGMYIRV